VEEGRIRLPGRRPVIQREAKAEEKVEAYLKELRDLGLPGGTVGWLVMAYEDALDAATRCDYKALTHKMLQTARAAHEFELVGWHLPPADRERTRQIETELLVLLGEEIGSILTARCGCRAH